MFNGPYIIDFSEQTKRDNTLRIVVEMLRYYKLPRNDEILYFLLENSTIRVFAHLHAILK